jgi:RNA polymerase sigma-70 factor (ECF subfamily)
MLWRRRDTTWSARFLRGDKDVIEEVYRTTLSDVRRAAGAVVGEPADRDAIVHETYLDLLSNRELRASYRGGALGAWLGAIARHRAIDFVRRQGRLTDLGQVPERAVTRDPVEELREELRQFANRLDSVERSVLELRYLVGMTQVEAASALGMPRSTLEDRERRIKQMLKAFLVPLDGDHDAKEVAS